MTRSQVLMLWGMLAIGLVPGTGQTASAEDLAGRCKALGSADFSQVQDAPTQITETRLVEASGDIPRYCEVGGYVAPAVGFVIRLPTDRWNGKFMEIGCGGYCGTTAFIAECNDPLHRGYACIASNGGHNGGGNMWAYNSLSAEVDYGYRAPHVTALAGKALVARYYGRPASKSYFWGCSSGGRQALMQAQRFPWDFDGIIAACPSLGVPWHHLSHVWTHRVLFDKAGEPLLNESELELVHRAVIARCDMNDGLKDGLIGDPRACAFEPKSLFCATDARTECLTAKQVEAVSKVYGGPVTSKGQQVYFAGPLKGSEKTWLRGAVSFEQKLMRSFLEDEFRYSGFYPDAGPKWQVENFDFDRDYKRLGTSEGLYTAANPDLRRFRAAGNKLIIYIGWNDNAMPLSAVDYYETVERTMGGRVATQEFVRLFAIPGMEHCIGGDGASAVDWLSALEDWVESGQAPEQLIGAHVDGLSATMLPQFPLNPATVEFTRPIYPYPRVSRYSGRGDPKDAANFKSVNPEGP